MTTQSPDQAVKASWFVEPHTIEPIPANERHGRLFNTGMTWAALNAGPTTIAAGGFGIVMGLPMWGCVVGIVVGSLIGGVLTSLHAEQGPRLGLPQMVQSRAQFGFYGNLLPGLGAAFTYFVYTVFTAILGYQGLAGLTGWDPVVCIVISLGLAWIAAVLGTRAINAVNVAATGLFAITTLMVAFRILPEVSSIEYSGEFKWAPFLMLVVFHVVGQLGNATYISDYTRYMPENSSRRAIFLTVILGGTGSAIVITILGMVAAARDLEAINADTLGYIGSLFPAISTPFVALLTLGCTVVGCMNLYSANQAVMTMVTSRGGSASAVLTRAVVCGIYAIAAGFVALAVSEDFLANIGGLVSTIAYVLIPWSAINLVDFFLIRHGHYDIQAIVDRKGKYGLFNLKAMSVYVIGVLVQIPFIVSDYPAFVGPIAEALGGLNFAWAVGFIVCSVLYWMLERGNTVEREPLTPLAGQEV
ncbi:MAG: cytosine permease [Propionibacteriaceae bacterium]|nr:cytosine permease [Propionibacteriaceae bacterium]